MSILGCTIVLGAVGAGSVHAAGTPSQAALPPASPPGAVKLSDEQLVTRWAYPERRAAVYSRPSGKARTVARLRLLTEDKFPELYVALSRWVDPRATRGSGSASRSARTASRAGSGRTRSAPSPSTTG